MSTPRALILSGYGINCEDETKQAFEVAQAKADIVHINDLISGDKQLKDYQILVLPGGFSYGDHIGAGKAMANSIINSLYEEVLSFVRRDTLTLGICNGFQILVAMGLVPALSDEYGKRQASLLRNDSSCYQCEWVRIQAQDSPCVWTKGINEMDVPIAHGEGNFYMDSELIQALKENKQVVWKYINKNPNGSTEDIAGICDPSGRILGMMPHPERYTQFTHHELWTKKAEDLRRLGQSVPTKGEGQKIFDNAVVYFS